MDMAGTGQPPAASYPPGGCGCSTRVAALRPVDCCIATIVALLLKPLSAAAVLLRWAEPAALVCSSHDAAVPPVPLQRPGRPRQTACSDTV
jgi:hypothetical protein